MTAKPTSNTRQRKLTSVKLRSIAKKLLSTSQWLDSFGIPYYGITDIPSPDFALPRGWHIHKFAGRNYLYYDPKTETAARTRGRTFSLEQAAAFNRLLERHKLGRLRPGDQKAFAMRLGVSESFISRQLQRGSPLRTESRYEDPAPHRTRMNHRVSRTNVETFFSVLLTVREWRDHFGRPRYGVTDLTYIAHMCASRPAARHAKTPARLPDRWLSVRAGGSWLIHEQHLTPREVLLTQTRPTHRREPQQPRLPEPQSS